MKKQIHIFVAMLATLFLTLTASAQGEWKWAHYWSGTGGEPGQLYNYVTNTADLSPYPAGTYLVKINFERGVSVVRKVVRS